VLPAMTLKRPVSLPRPEMAGRPVCFSSRNGQRSVLDWQASRCDVESEMNALQHLHQPYERLAPHIETYLHFSLKIDALLDLFSRLSPFAGSTNRRFEHLFQRDRARERDTASEPEGEPEGALARKVRAAGRPT